MRTLLVFLPSIEAGGLEQAMLRITALIADKGYAVSLLYAQCDARILASLDARVKPVRGLFRTSGFFASRSGRALACLPALVSGFIRERPDCVLSFQSTAVCAPVAALFGIPVIHRESSASGASLPFSHRRAPLVSKMVGFAKYRTCRLCDHVVAISQGTRESLMKLTRLPAERITVVYNPVDAEYFVQRAREPAPDFFADAGTEGAAPLIVYAGRFSAEKDVATLVRAFARCRGLEGGREARLLLIGEGGQREALRELAAALGVEAFIRMPGYVQNPQAHVVRGKIFVLSSLFEGLGNALLEAVALKVPVLSTECPGGPREILLGGLGGELVPVGDWRAMGDRLAHMLSHYGESLAKAETAFEGLSRFSPAHVADQYDQVIRSATGAEKGAR